VANTLSSVSSAASNGAALTSISPTGYSTDRSVTSPGPIDPLDVVWDAPEEELADVEAEEEEPLPVWAPAEDPDEELDEVLDDELDDEPPPEWPPE
jgi:hypothetical protein